jgi:AbrB family looped-hinge helix DNA binding protein
MSAEEHANKTVLRKKNIMTIPQDIADRMRLAEGDEFIATEEEGRIVLTPALSIPADQSWFWTPTWQARISEAEADRLAGNATVYSSEEEFLASLEQGRYRPTRSWRAFRQHWGKARRRWQETD